jgi:hypothetical protein
LAERKIWFGVGVGIERDSTRFPDNPADENTNRKALLDRIVAMLTKPGQRGYAVHEDHAQYTTGIDSDSDTDSDPDSDTDEDHEHG